MSVNCLRVGSSVAGWVLEKGQTVSDKTWSFCRFGMKDLVWFCGFYFSCFLFLFEVLLSCVTLFHFLSLCCDWPDCSFSSLPVHLGILCVQRPAFSWCFVLLLCFWLFALFSLHLACNWIFLSCLLLYRLVCLFRLCSPWFWSLNHWTA